MMNYFQIVVISIFLIAGCATKPHSTSSSGNSSGKSTTDKNKIYWKQVSDAIKTSLVCQGKILPLKYEIYETDYVELRKLLLRKSGSGSAINLDTTIIEVPVPNSVPEEFVLTQVQVLPPELSEKYPDIKTFQGKSVVYPQDNIRMDIAPKGISFMIMSTRGTIIMDPFCIDDSVHVIVYFKKDLPEGTKQDFEK